MSAPLPDPQAIIRAALGPQGLVGPSMLEEGRQYPVPLPEDIRPWYCYTKDGGHSLYVVVASAWEDVQAAGGTNPQDAMVAAPVRAVLQAGYTWRAGLPYCDLPYSPEWGLECEDKAEY